MRGHERASSGSACSKLEAKASVPQAPQGIRHDLNDVDERRDAE